MISFSIPGAPKGKGRPRFRQFGGHISTYTPETTREYEHWVLTAFAAVGANPIPAGAAAAIEITAVMPVPSSLPKYKKAALYGKPHIQKPDADNIAKAIIDGINGEAIADDCQFSRVSVIKRYVMPNEEPHATVTISPL